MDGHDRLDAPIELVRLEGIMQINGYQTCLPVVAVDDIGPERDDGQRRKRGSAEKRELLNILEDLSVRSITLEIELIVDEVEFDALIFHLEDADILLTPCELHIEMVHILHLGLILVLDTGILRDDDPYVELVLVQVLRQ